MYGNRRPGFFFDRNSVENNRGDLQFRQNININKNVFNTYSGDFHNRHLKFPCKFQSRPVFYGKNSNARLTIIVFAMLFFLKLFLLSTVFFFLNRTRVYFIVRCDCLCSRY